MGRAAAGQVGVEQGIRLEAQHMDSAAASAAVADILSTCGVNGRKE